MVKKISAVVLGGVVLGLAYWFFVGNSEEEVSGKREVSVTVTSAYEDLISNRIEALGVAIANESVDLMANVTEFVEDINFSDNQVVKKGDVLVLLRQKEELAQKHAEELQLKEHERELARLELLVKEKAVSKQQYDQRKTLLEISKQKISEIDASLQDRVIKAPFSGVLGLRNISVGSLVSPGEVITTIDDISLIKVDFTIPVRYLSALNMGAEVKLSSDAFPGEVFLGKVISIDSRANRESASIKVRAIVDNQNLKLKPGFLFKIDLFSNPHKAVLIREEAILQLQEKHYVFVLKDDSQAIRQEVSIAMRKRGVVEVTSGLLAGDKIILQGVDKVKSGDVVKVIENVLDEENKPLDK